MSDKTQTKKQQAEQALFLRRILGLMLIFVSTALSLAGLQSHADGIVQGLVDGVGFMMMVP